MDEIKKEAVKVIGEIVFNYATKKIIEEIPQGIANAIYKVEDIEDNDNIEKTKWKTKEGTIVDTKNPTSGEMKEELSEEMAKLLIELNKKGSEVAREERKKPKKKLKKELKEMRMKWREMKRISKIENAIKNDPEGDLADMWLELNMLKDELEKETNTFMQWFLDNKAWKISYEIDRLLKETEKKTETTTEEMAIEFREKKLKKAIKKNEEYKGMMKRELELIRLEMGRINELLDTVKNEPELSKMWLALIRLKDEMENETDIVKKVMMRKKVSPMLDDIFRMLKETKNETDKGTRVNTMENTKAVAENKTKKEVAEMQQELDRKQDIRDDSGIEETKTIKIDTKAPTNCENIQETALMPMVSKKKALEGANEKNRKHRRMMKWELKLIRLEMKKINELEDAVKNEPELSKMWPELIGLRNEMEKETDEMKKVILRKKVSTMLHDIYRILNQIKKKRRKEIYKGSKVNKMENTEAVAKNEEKEEIAEEMARLQMKMSEQGQKIAKETRDEPKMRLKKEMEEMKLKRRELLILDRMTIETKNEPNKELSKMWPILRQIKKEMKSETDKETRKRLKKEKSEMYKTIHKIQSGQPVSEEEMEGKTVNKSGMILRGRIHGDELWRELSLAQRKFMTNNPQTRCTSIGNHVYEAVFSKSISLLHPEYEFSRITADNFRKIFELLIRAEEAWEHTEMRKYDMKLVRIDTMGNSRSKGKPLYSCRVPGLSRGQPSIIPTDGLIMDDGQTRYSMRIVDIRHDLVTFEPRNSKTEVSLKSSRCDISFVPSGICYDRFLAALKTVDETRRFKEILFEGPTGQNGHRPSAKIDFCTSGTKELDKRFAILNDRQKQAIIHILEARCRPNLYILFGPPGTGKTFTLVETVVQIYKRNKSSKILVCSSSNLCVDSIASNIHDTQQIHSMVRFSSKHHYDQLLWHPAYYTDNRLEVKSSHRVVVTTNSMVARIMPKVLFDYVLVDEAGHANVLETLIPMTRLHPDACLVLAGDPKQLGPVIKSFEVERLGLGKSLLERMFERDLYRRRDGGYDEKYITKLVKSYRCDPKILGVCNDLFYDGDLKCLGKTPPSLLRILKVERPLVFVQVHGQESTPGSSTSRCNKIEARACINTLIQLYKMGLEPEQIGIITPYLLQKEMLSSMLKEETKKNGPMLDRRFKMPRLPTKSKTEQSVSVEKPTSGSDSQKISSNVSSGKLKDFDFLAKALSKMKLEAQKKQQARVLDSEFQKVPAMDWLCKIDTVDAFQGSERQVIIVSTVRSPGNNGKLDQCGFLADAKRFNVTISRAKWLVIVIGHPVVLDCCEYWKQFGKQSSQVKSI